MNRGRGRGRAPRLGPRTYLAPHLARRGRFAKVDPLKSRPLPAISRILGFVGWSALLGYSGWQAWRRRLVGRSAAGVPDSSGGTPLGAPRPAG